MNDFWRPARCPKKRHARGMSRHWHVAPLEWRLNVTRLGILSVRLNGHCMPVWASRQEQFAGLLTWFSG